MIYYLVLSQFFFIFAILERQFIYDDESECSFVFYIELTRSTSTPNRICLNVHIHTFFMSFITDGCVILILNFGALVHFFLRFSCICTNIY